MRIKQISGTCFAIAMLLLVVLLLEIPLALHYKIYFSFASLAFGAIGIILNLLTINESKHSIAYSIVYWSASLLLVVGIWMVISFYSNAKFVLYSGIVLLAISFFLPKKRKFKDKDSEVLDDF